MRGAIDIHRATEHIITLVHLVIYPLFIDCCRCLRCIGIADYDVTSSVIRLRRIRCTINGHVVHYDICTVLR